MEEPEGGGGSLVMVGGGRTSPGVPTDTVDGEGDALTAPPLLPSVEMLPTSTVDALPIEGRVPVLMVVPELAWWKTLQYSIHIFCNPQTTRDFH